MDANPEPLLEARLNHLFYFKFSPLELTAFADPKTRDDPNVHRQIRASYLQTTWNSPTGGSKPAIPVTSGSEPMALAVLRSAASAVGTALDFTHCMDATDASINHVRVEAYNLGLIAMVMRDKSIIAYDGLADAARRGPSEHGYSAWSSWQVAQTTITERRHGQEPPTDRPCLAEVTRHALEVQRADSRFLPRYWLAGDRMQDIANAIDPQMSADTRNAIMRFDIMGLVDGSVLVSDPNVGGWRSAANGDDCTDMLKLGYAPNRLDAWWRQNLTY
jgi:hypothetical protein